MKYKKEELEKYLTKGLNLRQIGLIFGVSKQRMYQVFNELNITTPEISRKSQLKSWNRKQRWLWDILTKKMQREIKQVKMEIFESLELPDICPVLNIPLNYEFDKSVRIDNSPSIDRIDSSLPYQKGNLLVVSWRANRLKNDGTWEEHQKIADYYKNIK